MRRTLFYQFEDFVLDEAAYETAAGDPSYSYAGALARVAAFNQGKRLGWRVELAAPFLLGLPEIAVAPAPAGIALLIV